MKHEELTGKIIGGAMQVHRTLENGFQGVICQRALAIEFGHQNINFEREKVMPVFYRDLEIGTRRVDFFVEKKIMVEIKARSELDNSHLDQAMNDLEAYQMKIGLLTNFGANCLQFKRVHNNKIM